MVAFIKFQLMAGHLDFNNLDVLTCLLTRRKSLHIQIFHESQIHILGAFEFIIRTELTSLLVDIHNQVNEG